MKITILEKQAGEEKERIAHRFLAAHQGEQRVNHPEESPEVELGEHQGRGGIVCENILNHRSCGIRRLSPGTAGPRETHILPG